MNWTILLITFNFCGFLISWSCHEVTVTCCIVSVLHNRFDCHPWNYSMDIIVYIFVFILICMVLVFWVHPLLSIIWLERIKNTSCTRLSLCITVLMSLHLCLTCNTLNLTSYFVCAYMYETWLTGCVCVSPSARDADEREKWIHALEGTILRHTLQLRVWNNILGSICVTVTVCQWEVQSKEDMGATIEN